MENGHECNFMEHHADSDSSSPTLTSSSPSSECPESKVCFGCQQPIIEEFRLRVAPDLEWHSHCLTCAECQIHLDETCTCFIKNGKTFCKKDYVRLFGIPCAACMHPISGPDLMMRASDQVYHISCFSCCKCGSSVTPGEQFGVQEGRLYCKSDYNGLQQDKLNSPTDHSSSENDHTSQHSQSNNSTTRAKRSNSDKGPRVRTVLSEQQLQTLRTVYASNPRPDALLKEHLVEITQLSPRVIRVWFQNKRCKDKKKMIHAQEAARQQQAIQQHGGAANAVIPPLTPQTPLTPDSISPHHSMSAFTYPPAPPNFETMQTISSQQSVSPIVTYQHNPAYGSPTDTLAHFDVNVDYTSPNMTPVEHHQTYVHSSATNSTQVTPYF